jgi:hypothetical protein
MDRRVGAVFRGWFGKHDEERDGRDFGKASLRFRPKQREPTKLRKKSSASRAQESVPGDFAERRKSVIRQVHHGGETSGTAGEINRTARGDREGAGGKARGACGKTASTRKT